MQEPETNTTAIQSSDSSGLLARSLTVEELVRRQRMYLEEIQPFIEMKARIYACQPIKHFITYKADGHLMEPEIMWTPGSKETVEIIDQIMGGIAQRIFQG